ncbi:MAG TPA: hypothetical protein VF671_16720 [Pseudomonas sp.]|uniref:hypothetical protein n=1 Tax=Pseudomonas sp. TaxID=306 RepID=UPI002EDA6F0C
MSKLLVSTAGRAKALDASTEKARPKISLLVFMISYSTSNLFATRYEANATRLTFIKKLIGLLAIIAKNDSTPQGAVFGRVAGYCALVVHLSEKSCNKLA